MNGMDKEYYREVEEEYWEEIERISAKKELYRCILLWVAITCVFLAFGISLYILGV